MSRASLNLSQFATLATHSSPAGASAPSRAGSGPRLPENEVADMTAQLAIMLRSGVDVATAIRSLANQARRPAAADLLDDVHDAVVGGTPFSQALGRFPRVFDDTYVATVAAGEASGKLADVLTQLAELKRGELRLGRTIRGLLMYPILLVVVASGVITALLTFVLPRFAELFERYNTELPLLTKMLLAVADELRGRWFVWGPLAGAAVAGLISLRVTARGRAAWDYFVVYCPLLSDVTRTMLVGRACRMMGLMMDHGVPLLEAVRLARKSLRNSLFQQTFTEIDDAITNGRGLAAGLQASDIIPPAAVEMLSTAERTGKLGEVSRLIGEYFQEDGEVRTRHLVGVLEPAITVVMGAIVAVVVLAVMLPVFDLTTFAGKGH